LPPRAMGLVAEWPTGTSRTVGFFLGRGDPSNVVSAIILAVVGVGVRRRSVAVAGVIFMVSGLVVLLEGVVRRRVCWICSSLSVSSTAYGAHSRTRGSADQRRKIRPLKLTR
jgi:hypothetical protein